MNDPSTQSSVKETAIKKLLKLSPENVSQVLIFMAGLDAGSKLYFKKKDNQERSKAICSQA